MATNKRYTASVVGGGSGGQLSMRALVASDVFEFVALADINASARESLAAIYPGVRTYASHREMFADCPTDVVCVSTWPPSHREVTIDALETVSPRGLLVEKPLGDTAAAGADILRAIKAAGLPVVVPHGLLQMRHSREIIDRVRGGEIGALDLVEIECDKWDIMNAGIHWLNFFVILVPDDPAEWVMALAEASTQTYRDGLQVETTAVTYVQTRGGVRCVMHTGDDVHTRREGKDALFRLVGDRGLIEFWGWESAYRLLNASHPDGSLIEVSSYAKLGHQRFLEYLAWQMRIGEQDYAHPESSLAALELCEAAYISSANTCKVNLPLAEFRPPQAVDWHPGKPYNGQGGRDGRKL